MKAAVRLTWRGLSYNNEGIKRQEKGGKELKKNVLSGLIGLVTVAALLGGCSTKTAETKPLDANQKEATEYTKEQNASVYQLLDFSDKQEQEFAEKGFLRAPEKLEIKAEDGRLVWSQENYGFIRQEGEEPGSVNPSLWRNTKQNALYGLFEVTEGIYQVRGYDLANITFVRSDNGWIVFDCTTSGNLPLLQQNSHIRIPDGGKSVCNDDRCAVLADFQHGTPYFLLGNSVH